MFSVKVYQTSRQNNLDKRKIIKICETAAGFEKKLSGSLDIIIVTSQAMRRLNLKWRGINRDTDVLSFAWRETDDTNSGPLGEIYLCPTKIRQQAQDFSVKISEELARVVVHGLLHLVGYDHGVVKDANKMFKLQEKIVDKICSRLNV